jgi:hypothetical protein
VFEQPTATFDRRHRAFFDTSDEPRQVYALDTASGQIVYLPDHAVSDSVRDACRDGRLRCPIAACPDPRLIAKGGTERRHPFAHKVAHTQHDSAAVLRTEAVAMLAAWARRYRGAQISTRHEGSLGIVTIRSAPTGATVELAVTYNPREQSDPMPGRQLLVGHARALLLPRIEHPALPDAWCCGDPRLVGQLIARHGAAVAVNPERQLVATLLTTRVAERVGLAPRNAPRHPTICLVDTIDDCRLDAHGAFTTPSLRTLRVWEDEHHPIAAGRARHARRAKPTPIRDGSPPPAPTIGVDALPPAAPADLLGPGTDINRIVVSGHMTGPRRAAEHEPRHWTLSIPAPDDHGADIAVEVELAAGIATAAGPGGAVVQGRLTNHGTDGRIAIVANVIQAAATPPVRPAGR